MSGRLAKFGAGVSLFPLLVLFSIELLDQATQSAFNVLTPNIRDAFHLTNAGILLIVAIAGAAALLFTLPVAVLADRMRRVPIALVGALVGAAFSIGLGVANGVVVAAVMLAGISMGQAVIFPTHNSLLADYYPVEALPDASTRPTAPASAWAPSSVSSSGPGWPPSGPGGHPSSSSPSPSSSW